jgi:hypothetical protein
VIVDAKRGDITSTNLAYRDAVFGYLGADAVTVQPYLGVDALRPSLNTRDKGVIVLCRTSNPGSGELQDLHTDGEALYQRRAARLPWLHHVQARSIHLHARFFHDFNNEVNLWSITDELKPTPGSDPLPLRRAGPVRLPIRELTKACEILESVQQDSADHGVPGRATDNDISSQ